MTVKTGNILRANAINDHLRASGVLDVDLNESRMITKRLTRKGFNILEVSLASLFLILVKIFRRLLD